ncbi:MAG: selenide, water dikinase SelD [Treponema sp.]
MQKSNKSAAELHTAGSLFVCGGCNAKIGAGVLSSILPQLPKTHCKGLLVGFDGADDAAVIQLTDDCAVIQTLDFFPPMVTDPHLFGTIAAANALSDIYAMGGEPVCALNIVCYPEEPQHDDSAYSVLKDILTGGTEKVQEAGAALVGGHSIHDPKIKYGLSVMGTVHPHKIWRNNTPRIGDVLFLTKKLGVGIVTTAYSAGELPQEAFNEAAASMTQLNKYAADILRNFTGSTGRKIHACTDVTGFGLSGHLLEMTNGTCTALLQASAIPFIQAAYSAAAEFLVTAGGQRNRNFAADKIHFTAEDFALEEIIFDPQTSGGLLFAVSLEDAESIRAAFRAAQSAGSSIQLFEIGCITEYQGYSIIVQE